LARPSRRGRCYRLGDGFRTIVASSYPNRRSAESSSGAVNGRPDQSYVNLLFIIFYWTVLDTTSGADPADEGRELIGPGVDKRGDLFEEGRAVCQQ